ncbi:conjugal transfer protein, partial [Salmonella enterica]|nr:conjugal transfer protein [Salmonella enterica]
KVKTSGTTIYNHSGGTITVVGANTGFTVTSTGLSKKECITLASQLGTSDMATTKINSSTINGIVSTIEATAACTTDSNTVALTTKS